MSTAVERTSALDFSLPAELEAHEPPEARGLSRDGVRLLVGRRARGEVSTHAFTDLPGLLNPGDVLVVNTSATVPAAVPVDDRRGLAVHLSTPLADGTWLVETRGDGGLTPRAEPAATRYRLPGGATVELRRPYGPGRLWVAAIDPGRARTVLEYLHRHGRPIRYPYVDRAWPLSCYQTVFARHPGSAEMPSAARPFTDRLVTDLATAGVLVVPVRLHTGVASFEADEPPYPERFVVPDTTARVVNEARAAGHRAIAVGTTSVRALESAVTEDGAVVATAGWTDLVITPERPVRAVDGLLTGFHEPRASHLRMLTAVVGTELIARCYAEAISSRLLWHEFGDTNLLLP